MFLRQISTGHMVEVLSLKDLFNPNHTGLKGCYHMGEEMQDPERFSKSDLEFLSGESLPRCWVDIHYRDAELSR